MSDLYYDRVPKDIKSNLLWRNKLYRSVAYDPRRADVVIDACRNDLLFYVNALVWTYDPRVSEDGRNPKLPFVTWGYQDEGFRSMAEKLGKKDILIEKSRDMGASWMCVILFHWKWLLSRVRVTFLMVSRKQALVDGAGDSLFGHMDFINSSLPNWVFPYSSYVRGVERTSLKMVNVRTGSRIEGDSTTENIGRGGRRTAMLLDEFAAFEGGGHEALAATADNTRCRIFNSTPSGQSNAFYAQRMKTFKLRFHWSRHPGKSKGLYRVVTGEPPEVLDAEGMPTGYELIRTMPRGEERLRSPWYDEECERRAHPVEVATQLDIDYQGSSYPFFDYEVLEKLRVEFCEDPSVLGMIWLGDDGEPEFQADVHGKLRLWTDLTEDGRIARNDREYVVGCDISMGTGASDSALSVVDLLTGEKVGEFCENRLDPSQFADVVVGVCRMFRGGSGRPAHLIWEGTGPGRIFGKAVTEVHHYGNVYYMPREDRVTNVILKDFPGWFSTADGKRELLHDYRQALSDRRFLNPSAKSLHQATEYHYHQDGSIQHVRSGVLDPSDTKQNHGDIVIADALACKLLRTKRQKPREVVRGPQLLSVAWRREQWGKKDDGDWWQ